MDWLLLKVSSLMSTPTLRHAVTPVDEVYHSHAICKGHICKSSNTLYTAVGAYLAGESCTCSTTVQGASAAKGFIFN